MRLKDIAYIVSSYCTASGRHEDVGLFSTEAAARAYVAKNAGMPMMMFGIREIHILDERAPSHVPEYIGPEDVSLTGIARLREADPDAYPPPVNG